MRQPHEIITKTKLAQQGFGKAAEEFCGPASVAMALDLVERQVSVCEVTDAMNQGGAFVEGKGTVLSRVPRCFPGFVYLPFIPTWLLISLLKMGVVCVHSVKRDDNGTGHIVCVSGYKDGMIYFYDPNKDDEAPQRLTARQWGKISNRRAATIRVIQ